MRILAILAASYSVAVLGAVTVGTGRYLLVLGCIFALLSLTLGLLCRRIGRRRIAAALCAAGLCVGCLWTFGYDVLFMQPVRQLDDRTLYLTGRVLQWPQKSGDGYSVLVRAETPQGRRVDALLYTDEQGADLRPGDEIGSVTYCTFADKTFSGEEITYYTAKGVFLRGVAYGTLTVEQPERIPFSAFPAWLSRTLEKGILSSIPGTAGETVLAVVTGNRDHLSDSFSTSLQRTGLSHTAAVSGMHMAYLAGALSLFLGRYRRRTALIVIPVCLLFALVAGCTPSVTRAAIMIVMLHIAPLFNRERDDVTALAAALLVLLIHNPMAAAHIGLQLSFGAVAGIFLVSERIHDWLAGVLHISQAQKGRLKRLVWRVPDYVVDTAATTVGAMVFTIPLTALHFSSLALLSPVSNLFTLWAVAVLFCGGLLVGVLWMFFPALAQIAAFPVTMTAWYVEWTVDVLGRMPLASITMDSFYYKLWTIFLTFAILFMLVKKSVRFTVVCSLLCLSTLGGAILFTAAQFASGGMKVTMLDVGQGQSVLLRQGSHLTMVDCGGDSYDNPGDLAANYLQNAGVTTVDLLVLTHFHDDHANGVLQLLQRLKVERLAVPNVDLDCELAVEILTLAREKKVECLLVEEDLRLDLEEGNSLILFAPLGEETINERGLTVLATSGEHDVLLTGDMGLEVERLLLKHTKLPDLEVLVAGHHGSKYATSQELLDAATPELVLISVGKDNLYGHPASETLERLIDCEVHRTDLEGTVSVRFG